MMPKPRIVIGLMAGDSNEIFLLSFSGNFIQISLRQGSGRDEVIQLYFGEIKEIFNDN